MTHKNAQNGNKRHRAILCKLQQQLVHLSYSLLPVYLDVWGDGGTQVACPVQRLYDHRSLMDLVQSVANRLQASQE